MEEQFPAARVAAYIRVSTQEQAIRGLSIAAQTEALDAWVQKNGLDLVDHYVDAGVSARKPVSRRPELQRLLADVRAKSTSSFLQKSTAGFAPSPPITRCRRSWRPIRWPGGPFTRSTTPPRPRAG